MFFIGGIAQKQEAIPFEQIIDYPNCHKFSHLKVFMTYTYFSFFFIPIFKWGKRYFVQSSCCNSICELDKEIGKGRGKRDRKPNFDGREFSNSGEFKNWDTGEQSSWVGDEDADEFRR